ncbi:hypothetical protein [Desulfovibrio sp. 86]|uniref:Uncharacterized protein n=1 Tax=uncultured Desulfovibrio sp. TaxID=167968 RepID=A0A212L9H0_9BACT|nr:hypothetical protein [Desulfovibrio sp. 86]SCM74158.1 hypothetical protein KL86DES1_21767 [uncultured Desulfovibrio sp.]VZH34668.1 conserved protein of unknown function [Desulfovibrio sp. 86]
MDGISTMIGLIVGAIAGGCVMHARGYTRGRLDEMSGKDRLDSIANELQEVKSSIEDLKIGQEVLDIMVKEIKSGC